MGANLPPLQYRCGICDAVFLFRSTLLRHQTPEHRRAFVEASAAKRREYEERRVRYRATFDQWLAASGYGRDAKGQIVRHA